MADPKFCAIGCCCAPCSMYYMRKKALGGDLSKYSCCQGYYNLPCQIDKKIPMQKDQPELCLALESCLFGCMSISATRMLVMDNKTLTSDPCDNRMIALNNCLQSLACICTLLAICIPELQVRPLRQPSAPPEIARGGVDATSISAAQTRPCDLAPLRLDP